MLRSACSLLGYLIMAEVERIELSRLFLTRRFSRPVPSPVGLHFLNFGVAPRTRTLTDAFGEHSAAITLGGRTGTM